MLRSRGSGRQDRYRKRTRWSSMWSALSNRDCNELCNNRAGQLDQQPDAHQLQCTEQSVRLWQQAQNDEAKAKIVHLGQGVQTRQRVREAEQTGRPRQKEERTRRDGGNGEDVKREVHPSLVAFETWLSWSDAVLTNATAANAANSANSNATSTTGGVSVAAASKRRTATPPVPSSCAAIMWSTSAGRRRITTKPSATVVSTKPAAVNRKLVIALCSSECLHAQGFLRCQLFDHRLRHIETMNDQAIAFRGSARKRAWQQTHDGAERISLRARREARLIDHDARPQRQPGIKRPQCHVYPGSDRLTQKVQHESGKSDRTQAPLLRRQQA